MRGARTLRWAGSSNARGTGSRGGFRARSRRELAWHDARLRKLDIEYHDIDLRRGLYYRLEAEGRVERLLEDEEIKRFVQRPPEDTRAYFRSECLRRYRDAITHANWDVLTFDCGEQRERKVPLADPLRGTREMVQDLLEASGDAKALLERLAG